MPDNLSEQIAPLLAIVYAGLFYVIFIYSHLHNSKIVPLGLLFYTKVNQLLIKYFLLTGTVF
jgi:hypothetical protein